MDEVKNKVLFIIPTLNPGGIETYLMRFLNYLNQEESIEPHVLVRSFEKGKLYEQYQAFKIPIYFQPLGFVNLKYSYWYYTLFKKEKFDTVCDFNANFAGIPMWLAKLAGVNNRIAFYRQGKDHFNPDSFRRFYNFGVKNLVSAFSTQILSNSKASLDYFFPQWKNDGRFKVVYNGMDVNDFKFESKNNRLREELGIPLDSFVVSHSGRLDPAKNHETILKVAKQLIEANKNIYFILCGLYTENLQNKVDDFGIDENFRILGFRKEVPEILNASDMFYFPSITEGQPNALIEAMLSGLPFVASNIAPIKEIVPENLFRYLVNPLEVEGCVIIIEDLIKNRERINAEITQCWAREYFSKDLRFKDFYNCLINK